MVKEETLTPRHEFLKSEEGKLLNLHKIMSYFTRFFLSLTLLSSLASCSAKNQDIIVQDGNVIYTYENGTIQCLSEKSAIGTTVVLIKSLKENTVITDVDLGRLDGFYAIKALMAVRQNKANCAGWIDTKEVIIAIQPIDVPEITLEGKPVITRDGVIVLIPFDAKLGFEQIIEQFEP